MDEKNVTIVFGGNTATEPCYKIKLKEFCDYSTEEYEILDPETKKKFNIKKILNHVRQLVLSGFTDEAIAEKNKLPYVLTSGVFSYRNNTSLDLDTYTWIVGGDIDRKDNTHIKDWVALKQLISSDPSVIWCFISPRGEGIKFGMLLEENSYDPKNQYHCFRDIVYPDINKRFGIKCDISQGKLSQPYYFTYDSEGYVNLDAVPKTYDFSIAEQLIIEKVVTKVGDEYFDTTTENDIEKYTKLIREKEDNKYNFFGKIALLVGGLFEGGLLGDMKETEVLDKLLEASKQNQFVKDQSIAETQIRNSFKNGRLKPITKSELSVNKNVTKIVKRLNQMNTSKEFIRVGNDYYEISNSVDQFKRTQRKLYQRKRQTLTDDYGLEFLEKIPHYVDFCNVPNNISYEQVVNGCYNLYAPFPHIAVEGEFPTIKKLLNHIFGEQLEMGYDYIQLLYEKPAQVLPVLCLISKENATGKSTFLEFLSAFFVGNTAILSVSDIEGNFNQHYATKLLKMVDESELHKAQNTTKIKQMATEFRTFRKAKFENESEVASIGKFIICSNNETGFINIKDEDTRYWLRKLAPVEDYDPDFEVKMIVEIPHFLHFLQNRTMLNSTKKSRAWFDTKDLNNVWLDMAKNEGKSTLWVELNERFTEYFLKNPEKREIIATTGEIIREFLRNNPIYTVKWTSKTIREEFGTDNSMKRVEPTFNNGVSGSKPGAYFIIERKKIISDELAQMIDTDVPTDNEVEEVPFVDKYMGIIDLNEDKEITKIFEMK